LGGLNGRPEFEALLDAAKRLHVEAPELRGFCDWPNDLSWADLPGKRIPAADLVEGWEEEGSGLVTELHRAIRRVVPHADWRRTYTEAEVGAHFLANYGYFELFGPKGHFLSSEARGYVGFWGPGLDYDWHGHEAEEIYFVVAGGALFRAEGADDEYVAKDGSRRHKPWQRHAMSTRHEAVLTFVLWKGAGLDGVPAMTGRD